MCVSWLKAEHIFRVPSFGFGRHEESAVCIEVEGAPPLVAPLFIYQIKETSMQRKKEGEKKETMLAG